MQLRVLHTADWHLGHQLHDISREDEHTAFLSWLLETLKDREIDALLIAGDIFDVANPSASAQAQWYQFLNDARHRVPNLDIVAIAGNHDSASRLEAPRGLLDSLGMHVVGRLPRRTDDQRSLDIERILVPLHNRDGDIAGYCAAVPFLRPNDLPRRGHRARGVGLEDELVAGIRQIYAELATALAERSQAAQARIAMGHLYMTSSQTSELSERRILGGHEHAVPHDVFGPEFDYVALGHMHLGQRVGPSENIRYSGSPIPLSLSEAHYKHAVCLAEFENGRCTGVERVPIPRSIDMIRVPARAAAPPEEVEALLRALPPAEDGPKPYLEARVRLSGIDSGLRRRIEDILEDRNARLLKLSVEYSGSGDSLAESVHHRRLQDLSVDEVFASLYARQFESEPSPELWACFREIAREVENPEDA